MPMHKRVSTALRPLAGLGGRLINSLRLNTVTLDSHHGRPVAVKRRTIFGFCAVPLANLYFQMADVPVHLMMDVSDWQWREILCFRSLNEHFDAVAPGRWSVREELLPGRSLWEHLKAGTLTKPMLRAAGKELRRIHGLWSDVHNGPFSHGDAAMRNVLFDPVENRVRFIDFELVHNAEVPAIARQAEDLASFLLDLVGLIPRRKWLPWALYFLQSYGDQTVIRELANRLEVPRGAARFWWRVRTNFADVKMILPRLERLGRAIMKYQERQPGPAPHPAFSPASASTRALAMS